MERKVKLQNYLAYGVGDFLGGGSLVIIGTFLLFFLTEVVGMVPFYAGLVFAVGKVWDGISDPLMGYISDRTRSRFGRRRFYFLIGLVPSGVFFALLWFPINIETQLGLFFYYLMLYIFFNTSYTILMVPYTALNAEMSLDYKTRSRLSGFKQFSSGVSSGICSIGAQPIISYFPDQTTGFMVMGVLFALFFSLPYIAVFLGTWEARTDYGQVEKQTLAEIFKNFFSVFLNRSFRLHVIMYVSGFAGLDTVMALFMYFLTYYIGNPDLLPVLMASLFLSQGIAMPLHIKLGNTWGKGRAYMIGAVLWMLGMVIAYSYTPETPVFIMAAGAVVIGFGMAGVTVMPWAILPSVTDVDILITGDKRAGTYSGMMTLLRKIVNGLVAFFVGVALTLIGFESGQVQTPDTQQSLRVLFALLPITFVFIGFLTSLRFKITPRNHQIMMDEISRLESGGSKADVDEETRKICEDFTGKKYEDLGCGSDS